MRVQQRDCNPVWQGEGVLLRLLLSDNRRRGVLSWKDWRLWKEFFLRERGLPNGWLYRSPDESFSSFEQPLFKPRTRRPSFGGRSIITHLAGVGSRLVSDEQVLVVEHRELRGSSRWDDVTNGFQWR